MAKKYLLAGIAKNEAAYLPEWIFYHLRLGIDSILIYVNDTDDNTCEILDKIGRNHPVEYCVVDGIADSDTAAWRKIVSNPVFYDTQPLQSKSYARILHENKAAYDCILFLDLDEFLLERTVRLRELIDSQPGSGVFYFKWFNVAGEEMPFQPLTTCTQGAYRPVQKYLINTAFPEQTLQSAHEVDTGETCADWNDLRRIGVSRQEDSIVIVHRFQRSLPEYLALLSKGDRSESAVIDGFKYNRDGWSQSSKDTMVYSGELFADYEQSYESFLSSNGLEEDLKQAQAFVMQQSSRVRNRIESIKTLNRLLTRSLRGTNLRHQESMLLERIKLALPKAILRILSSVKQFMKRFVCEKPGRI
jgi:hypothetical protein